MKKRILPLVLVAAVLMVFCGKKPSTGDSVVWYDFNTGMQKAKELKRPVVIDFYASWCQWCTVMDRETFGNAEVSNRLKKDFIPIRIDLESGNKITMGSSSFHPQQFASMLGVRGLPSVAFLDRDGGLITLIPGFIKPDTFLPMLDYIKSECYLKKVSFTDYMKKGNCGN